MHIQGGAMKRKLVEKGDMTELGVQYTDWEATGQAAKSMTANDKLWLAKFCSGFSSTASQMWYRELAQRKKEEKLNNEKKDECSNASNTSTRTLSRSSSPDGTLVNLSYWKDDLCPLCRTGRENTKHVLRCQDDQAKQYRKDGVLVFANWLRDQRTDPVIVTCLSGALQNSTTATFELNMEHTDCTPLHLAAAREQDEIGCINFFLGRISQKWREV